jgi:hypothetical protein
VQVNAMLTKTKSANASSKSYLQENENGWEKRNWTNREWGSDMHSDEREVGFASWPEQGRVTREKRKYVTWKNKNPTLPMRELSRSGRKKKKPVKVGWI